MTSDLLALIAGTMLAVGALGFVIYPLFFNVRARSARRPTAARAADDSAIVALREIEFDRATGKLSDADYSEMRETYTERALRELRGGSAPAPQQDGALDAIEARVQAYRLSHRECPTCGLRPEPDAIYCSTCGGFLDRVCPECSAEITEPSATFCSKCGATLVRSSEGAFA
jgi:hypothetical protein